MKLIANGINQIRLRDILPVISEDLQVDGVLAAIAYGGSASDEAQDLIGHALKNKLRVDLWMRYDHTVPVHVSFLRRLKKHQANNIFTQFVPDCFHPKVIWWKGYGAYIGSANHTDRGWLTNIEAGLFVEEDELIANGIDTELEGFFDYLRDLDKCIPISDDYIREMERLSDLNKNTFDAARKARTHAIWDSPAFVAKKAAFDRRKEKFKTEWLSTLGILQSIQGQLADHRPRWIDADVPEAWVVDQFLHAFYYNRVGEGLSKPYDEYYAKNKHDPNGYLKQQLAWWQQTPEAPSNEDRNLCKNAPDIRALLEKDKVLTLSEQELADLFRKTHATMDYVIKIDTATLGRPDASHLDRESRVPLFARLMMSQRNKKGWDIRQILHYVLYEGKNEDIWERLFNAGRDRDYSIARYGLNSLAEVVGWARPDVVPPRNGRTSKALKALGFDVRIY